jgi:hypothetical protein
MMFLGLFPKTVKDICIQPTNQSVDYRGSSYHVFPRLLFHRVLE